MIEILEKDDVDTERAKKENLAARMANKKGYRDLVMSTEGISLNIVVNATSDKLSKGDLRKAWGRLERRWNPKTRERQSRGLHQIPELQTRKCQTESNGLVGILGEKRTELSNTGYMMDNEMFITHLLNSLPQSEYEGAILVIKDKFRKGKVDLPEIEQILEDKYQSMKHVKGWDEEEDDYALFTSHSNKKSLESNLRDVVDNVGNLDVKQLIVPITKAISIRAQKENPSIKRNRVPKETTREKDIRICVIVAENMDIMHVTV